MRFHDILKGMESEGKEKHVPVIEIGKGKGEGGADIVHVVVGKETPHPNTVEHHIDWIELFGVKQDGLVHTSNLSQRFVKNPIDVVSVGDIIDVEVISIDKERGRIGLKRLESN